MARIRRARTDAKSAAQILREYKDRIESLEESDDGGGVQRNKNIFDFANCTDQVEYEKEDE